MCAKVVEHVSHTWEALIDDAELEKVTDQFRIAETEENQLKNERKNFPLVEKMAKSVDMKKIQQQVVVLRNQQQYRTDKVIEW